MSSRPLDPLRAPHTPTAVLNFSLLQFHFFQGSQCIEETEVKKKMHLTQRYPKLKAPAPGETGIYPDLGCGHA